MTALYILLAYLLMINLSGYLAIARDKEKAKTQQWRTPEKNFFIMAFLGGSIGVWLGMQRFHHKTKHYTFTVGIPVIFCLQLIAVLYCSIKITAF